MFGTIPQPQRVCEHRLSDRTARTPSVKLLRPARCAMALRAAAHNSSRMNRPCRVRRAGPARPHSLGAHGTRRCRGLELPGRNTATGTGWIRSFVAPHLRHCVTSVKGHAPERSQNTCKSRKVECTTWWTKRDGSGTDGAKTDGSRSTNVLRVSRALPWPRPVGGPVGRWARGPRSLRRKSADSACSCLGSRRVCDA